MNYINRPKSAYTQEERIKYLEESIRELRKEKDLIRKEKGEYHHKIIELEKENKKLKSREEKLMAYYKWYVDKDHNLTEVEDIITENIKLKEENSYRAKVFDIIPQDEKSVAEETIQDLQERIRFLEQCLDNKEKVNKSLREENQRLSDFLECEA